jgi:hypothetical protein
MQFQRHDCGSHAVSADPMVVLRVRERLTVQMLLMGFGARAAGGWAARARAAGVLEDVAAVHFAEGVGE